MSCGLGMPLNFCSQSRSVAPDCTVKPSRGSVEDSCGVTFGAFCEPVLAKPCKASLLEFCSAAAVPCRACAQYCEYSDPNSNTAIRWCIRPPVLVNPLDYMKGEEVRR